MNALMDQPAAKTSLRPPAFSLTHRLVLAAAAAGTVMTLCWAALQVRAAKDELRQVRAAQPAAPAAPDRTAELERRLAEAEARAQRAETESALRAAEMERIIDFLRQENAAAQQTIERLSNPAPPERPENPGAKAGEPER